MSLRHNAATPVFALGAALVCSSLSAAPPRGHGPAPSHSSPRAHFTGTGASYMQKYITTLGTPHSLLLQASAAMSQTPKNAKTQHRDMTIEVAWTGPAHYYSRSSGVAGTVTLVNTGSNLYEYVPARKMVLKAPYSQAARGFQLLEMQVTRLLPLPLPHWDHVGTRSVGGHPCDLLVAHYQGAQETLYLDRTTHMPRRVIVTNSVPAGVMSFDATFSSFEVNRPVPASLFRFTPPPGVKVTTMPSGPPPVRGLPPHR
ncbi:MAG: DUF2092 domain-containing protein [Chloroflexi bacterium]|nr:DUF2092 domain-containing protein [Chloroflexota bacterium]